MDVQERIEKDVTFRSQVLDWLCANGIDSRHVPAGERPSLVDGMLTARMFTLNAKGAVQFDPIAENKALTHTVTVPMVVEPNADVLSWLTPPCSTCGR